MPIHILHRESPPLNQLVDLFLQHPAHHLSTVILPSSTSSSAFRKCLLNHPSAPQALTLPLITTLSDWVQTHATSSQKILNNHARQLMLVEVLHNATVLRGKGSPWQLADELLKLFDDLELSGQTPSSLTQHFEQNELSHFSNDAKTISILWSARRDQLIAEHSIDRPQRYSEGLTNLESHKNPIFLLGYDWFHQGELKLLTKLLRDDVTHILLANYSPAIVQFNSSATANIPQNKKTQFLEHCFKTTPPLKQRCETWINQNSPIQGSIETFKAQSPENEVNLIDVQVRQWLIDGCTSIAIITEDRRLARRLSAVLSNSGIECHDDAGWPLSTTVAAGVIERWLECIESDFPYRPLLDVIKSPFLKHPSAESLTVYHFERDVIEHEKIGKTLSRYHSAIDQRTNLLDTNNPEYSSKLHALLKLIEKASAPLSALLETPQAQPEEFLTALESSLKDLSLWQGFNLDSAGQRITQEIIDMRQSLSGRELTMNWGEFRTWLSRSLETHNFRPAKSASAVTLTNLARSQASEFNHVIIAGLDNKQLPGSASRLIFFNDQIIEDLGLPSWNASRSQRFTQFRNLLETSNRVLLTYSCDFDGEPRLPSPWLSRLQTFHETAFGIGLPQPCVASTYSDEKSHIKADIHRSYPKTSSAPKPSLPLQIIPNSLSAGAHQKLIDCPYQYFAQYGLKLRANEEIIEQLNNADYGTQVHRCLEAFHSNVDNLPGPAPALKTISHTEAIEILISISRIVFNVIGDSELRDQHWYEKWETTIPDYIKWQFDTEKNWKVSLTEKDIRKVIEGNTELMGKIDRIDKNPRSVSLIDYKTGSHPKPKEQLSGEKIQLLSYALLVSNVSLISFLSLKPNDVKQSDIEEEKLKEILPDIKIRLQQLIKHLNNDGGLPANGNGPSCDYCSVYGLCRKGSWEESI